MSISKFALACLLALLQGGTALAQEKINTAEERRVVNVARIFMHTTTSFSLLVPVGEADWGLIDASNCVGNRNCDEQVFLMDVPADKPMWYRTFRYKKPGAWIYTDRAEFHIHAPANIEGGGWLERVGKTTYSRNTHVIQ